MPFDDPQTWSQGAVAFKSIFDGLRSAIGMLRDLRGSGEPSTREGELIDAALDKATKATAIAEAEVAQALGYQLCKCEFPPTPMLTVGSTSRGDKPGTVYECPKCKHNTSAPFTFNRLPGK
ncbi:hypothetical protein ACVWW4_000873 [Bradyrhizobium sp. LB7.1]